VIGAERDRVGEIGLEIGHRLAGNPVDQIQREIVEARVPQMRERAPHVLGPRAALQHPEQVRAEALRAE